MGAASDKTDADIDGLPAAYAAWRASTLGQVTDALEEDLLLDLIGPASGRRILDVGCGDGALAVELASRGADVTGIDASPKMIAAAQMRAKRCGTKADFAVADAETLPVADESFDIVVAVTLLCFVPDARKSMSEMARVLIPSGRAVIGELGKWSLWAAKRRIKGWRGSPVWHAARFRTAGELKSLALAAGLVEPTVTGAVFYPPSGLAARLCGPMDRRLEQLTTLGAAFLGLSAQKPESSEPQDLTRRPRDRSP